MKKTLIVLMMVMLSVMLFVSCSPEAEAVIKYDDLIGYWQQGSGSDYVRIRFKKDYTFTLEENSDSNPTVTMTASLKDNVLTLTATDPSGEGSTASIYTYKLSFDGDKLVLTQTSEESMCSKHTDKTFTMEKRNFG